MGDINVHVLDAEQNLLEKDNFYDKCSQKAVSDLSNCCL